MRYEYKVEPAPKCSAYRLGIARQYLTEFLNKQDADGWEFVNCLTFNAGAYASDGIANHLIFRRRR